MAPPLDYAERQALLTAGGSRPHDARARATATFEKLMQTLSGSAGGRTMTKQAAPLKQHLDNLRRKDSLRGAATTEISVRLRNYSASHFEGSAYRCHSRWCSVRGWCSPRAPCRSRC